MEKQECIIIVHPDGQKSIKYDAQDWLWHELIDYYTIKELTKEQIEEIKTCTFERLQQILNHYI